ncbi:hypothetical protein [Burkholderia sp. LMU1-1-1.1]|uniref:hypothetical protein n=1 Tax=Burkholderia sp. LMU1-1-1.1 TaxID=3135266 RepID=UPI00343537B8
MTTISNTSIPSAEAIAPRRVTSVAVTGKSESYLGKALELTAQQKAETVKVRADMAAGTAAAEKQAQEVKKRLSVEGMESHQMYLPNISDLSLENAKKSLDIAEVMIKNKEDVGVTVNGRYGDKDISDLGAYKAALTDYIGKYETAMSSKATGGGATVPTQASTTAASTYRQMQVLIDKGGSEG